MNYNKSIELLAPAGAPDVLNAAIGEGADAVYLGFKDFNARNRAKNFSYKEVQAIIEKVHWLNKKVYITLNTVFEEWESDRIFNVLKFLNSIRPDGIIIQDLGIVRLTNENFPDLKIHASTQMNISSSKGVNFLSKNGVRRVVLGRELGLDQIKEIRSKTNLELELFVHGALCISVSGLCLFSSYLGGKSANRGMCTQPCRRLYKSDIKNGFIFSTKDLMLIDHVPDMIDIGINSFKIEGRMRSAEYVGSVVRAYRYLIDNYQNDREGSIKKSKEILEADFARKKTEYYYSKKEVTNEFLDLKSSGTGIYLGDILEVKIIDNKKYALIKSSRELSEEDTVRIQSKDDKRRISVKIRSPKIESKGTFFNIPDDFSKGDQVYLISIKKSKESYPRIIPKDLRSYKKHPGNLKAPNINSKKSSKEILKQFPTGLYVKLSDFRHIFITQSMKPQKIILTLTKENLNNLKKSLNSSSYKPNDIIIYLEPFFTVNDENWIENGINELIDFGFKKFIVNNPGQISILKNKNIDLICGPYLYTFNKYSIDFYKMAGCKVFISPVENNKRNLLSSTKFFDKNEWLLTIYTFPELFQIKNDIGKHYNFDVVSDKTNNEFRIISFNDRSLVLSQTPFSLIDKISFLRKSGFKRFILDLSYLDLKKGQYKNIIKAAQTQEILKGTSRFNWKNGFYRIKD